MRLALAFTGLFFLAASASAQVIYTPIQYQYGRDIGNPYYYGGHDPRVFAAAQSPQNTTQGQTYSDTIPFTNAAIYGYGPDDARNEANANIPRYFRKRDLLAGAIREPDGSAVVPADSVGIPTREVARPARSVGTILIIPKRLLTPPHATQAILAKAD
jgi:hypothetical protein